MMAMLLVCALFISSLSSAEYQYQPLDNERNLIYEPREFSEERSWNRPEEQQQQQQQPQQQQSIYDNDNFYADSLRQKPSPNFVHNSIDNEYTNAEYDDSKQLAAKRAWKLFNDRNRGWGKREQQQGNWNNLRGLWGKRSSWSRLQGTWG
jgi:hypothetical protein